MLETPTYIKPSSDEFVPKLLTSLREGYGLNGFRRDVMAGLTVAIVALPLSMAIAIASHASPEKGLYTAIVGGFVISALGGSRFQIGGPAGAFIVLLASLHVRRELIRNGIKKPDVRYGQSVESCIAAVKQGHDIDSSDE